MRAIKKILSNPYSIIVITLVVVLTAILDTDFPYGYPLLVFFGFCCVWAHGWKWRTVGLHKPHSWRTTAVYAVLWTVGLMVFSFTIRPFIETIFGPHDLSFFETIRGNTTALIAILVQIWIIVAFFEEFAFRGYLQLQLQQLLGNSPLGTIVALLLSAIIFGVAHSYQGLSGTILTGSIGLLLGTALVVHKKNLWLTILVHGLFDTLYMILIYTSYDIKLNSIMQQFLN